MDPKCLQKCLKIDEKCEQMLGRLTFEAQGLILEVQGPILELKIMIFRPPEAIFFI